MRLLFVFLFATFFCVADTAIVLVDELNGQQYDGGIPIALATITFANPGDEAATEATICGSLGIVEVPCDTASADVVSQSDAITGCATMSACWPAGLGQLGFENAIDSVRSSHVTDGRTRAKLGRGPRYDIRYGGFSLDWDCANSSTLEKGLTVLAGVALVVLSTVWRKCH